MSEEFEFNLRLQKNEHLHYNNQKRQIAMKNEHLMDLKVQNEILFEKLKSRKSNNPNKSNMTSVREREIQALRHDYQINTERFKFNEEIDLLKRSFSIQTAQLEDSLNNSEKLKVHNKDLLSENFKLKEQQKHFEQLLHQQRIEVEKMQINTNSLKKEISKVKYIGKPFKLNQVPIKETPEYKKLEQEIESKSDQIQLLLQRIERLQIEKTLSRIEPAVVEMQEDVKLELAKEKNKNEMLLQYINSCEQLIFKLSQ